MLLDDDPVYEILSMKSSVHIPSILEEILDKDDDCFRELPEYHRPDLEDMFKNLQDFSNITEILQKINFSFPFRPDLIPIVSSLTIECDPNFRYRSRFIFYTFIAWIKNPIMEHAPVVIHALTELLDLPDYSKCALNAIERCFQISFVKSPLDDFEIIFPLFKKLFLKQTVISMKKQVLLFQYLRALQISSQEKGKKDTPEIMQYMKFLEQISSTVAEMLNSNPNESKKLGFQNDTITQIFTMSSNLLAQLDMTALNTFSILSQYTSEDVMIQFAMVFAKPLKTMVETGEPFLVLRDQNSTEIDLKTFAQNHPRIDIPPFSLSIEGQFQYAPVETFKSGLDIQMALIISEEPKMSFYFRYENYQRILKISEAYQKHEMSARFLFDWFCGTIKEMSNSPYFFDFVMVFIAFYRHWCFPQFAQTFWDVIFDTVLFDDRFNVVVNENNMPSLIDNIRATVISLLARIDGFSLLHHVFDSITTRPALMAEMLHRILQIFDNINTANLNNSNLIRTISALLIYFQNIHFDSKYESIIPFVEASRSSLFLFISRILQIDDCVAVWMENKVFCITFLKFVSEPPIRPFILTNVKNYLLSKNFAPAGILGENSIFDDIHQICIFAFDRIPQEQYVIISTEILQMINECMSHQNNMKFLKSKFIGLVELVSSAINNLSNESSAACGDFLVQAIHFFASLSSEINLGNSQMILIKEATKKIFGNEPSNAIFSKFVQLIAGTPLSSISPSFIIKQPFALFPLVEVFRQSKTFLDILKFIHMLIGYSYYNAIIANEYNFDSFLLSIIQSHKCDLEIDSKIIESLFQIVSLVCSTTSSAPVIQKFIDLMCPINGKYISKYQPLYIQKLQEIISSTTKAPLAFLPLNGKSTYIEIKNITSSFIGKTFTIAFWMSLDKITSESKLNIFSITDYKGRGIFLVVSTTSLLIKVIHKDLESTARCETPLPMGLWTPILIRIKISNGKALIAPNIDRCICRKLEFACDGFNDEYLKIQIGNSPDQDPEEVPHILLSSFQIYNKDITNDEIPRLYDSGPRQSITELKEALFTLQLSNNKGDIGLTLYSEKNVEPPIEARLVGDSIRCHPSFCSVLISGEKADLFMPLFSFFDMTTIEEKYLLTIPDLTFDLIMTILSISQDVQIALESKNGFKIIMHLLLETKIFKPTYSTYNRLFMLLPILTFEKSKISLMKYILVNFALLSKFDRANQKRIVKHWARVLVYENQNILTEVWSVKRFLCAIEQYIIDKLKQKENPQDIQIHLFKLLTMIASYKLTKDDLEALICFALNSSDDQSICILKLFIELVRSESTSIEIIKENYEMFYSLHNIVKKNNHEIFFLLIDLIYELHDQNIITNITTQQHFDIIIHLIQRPLLVEEVLMGLIDRINEGKHELLPIACFAAMNMEEDYMSTLFSGIKHNYHNLTIVPRFWVITLASIAPPDIRTQIIEFIIESQKSIELNDIFYAVEIVSTVLYDEHLPHELILILAQDLVDRLGKLDKNSNNSNNNQRNHEIDCLNTQIDLLFQFASSKIFFHHTLNTRIMEEEFSHSMFYDDNEDSVSSEASISSIDSDASEFTISSKYRNKENSLRASLKSSSVASHLHKMDNQPSSSKLGGNSLSTMISLEGSYPASDVSDSDIIVCPIKKRKRRSVNRKKSSSFSTARSASDSESPEEFKYPSNWIFDKIRNYEKRLNISNRKVFLIRTDKSGRWLDCDIAEWCMKLFDKRRDNLFLNFALLLIAFMLKSYSNSNDIESHLTKMQLKQSQIRAHESYLYLIKRNVQRFKRNINTSFLNLKDDEYKAFSCYNQFVDSSKNQVMDQNILKMAKSFIKTHDNTNQFSSSITVFDVEFIDTVFTKSMKAYNKDIKEMKESASKLWNHSWRSMTFELGPWELAVVSTSRVLYERSLVLNHSLIPVKMRRKMLNDSVEASKEINEKGYKCLLISPKRTIDASLSINFSSKKIRIISFLKNKTKTKAFDCDAIRYVIPINRKKKSHNCFEMILHNGKSYLIDLLNQKLHPLLKEILDISSNNENSKLFTPQFKPKLDQIMDKWVNNEISTFNYIIKLNIFAGRSFNDIAHYPLFPWVMKMYYAGSPSDNHNQNLYRDFSELVRKSPISSLSLPRERAKSSIYQKTTMSNFSLSTKHKSEANESDSEISLSSDIDSSSDRTKLPSQPEPSDLQDSEISSKPPKSILMHASESAIQLKPPAIKMTSFFRASCFNESNSNEISPNKANSNSVKLPSFSQPFHDYVQYVNTLLCRVPYNIDSNNPKLKFESLSDVFDQNRLIHEAIPELFFLPECLSESDTYSAVNLPLWAKSPIDFVYEHRKILESDFISSKIHLWFDYTFGVKSPNSSHSPFGSSSSNVPISNPEEEDEGDEENSLWPLPQKLFLVQHRQRKTIQDAAESGELNSTAEIPSHVSIRQPALSMMLPQSPEKDKRKSTPFITSSNSYHNIKIFRVPNNKRINEPISFQLSLKDSEFVFASIDTSQYLAKSIMTFLMVTSKGTIKRIEIDLTEASKKSANDTCVINPKINSLPDDKIDKQRIPPKRDTINKFVPLDGGFILVSGQDSLLLIYDKNSVQKTIRAPFGNIKSLCSSYDYFATIGTDMTTRIFKADKPDQPIYSISTYQGDTTCAAISKNFGIFVSGSIDGAIHIGSLSNGNVQKVVNIENKPIRILISEGWGFIVVLAKVMPSSNPSFFSSRPSNLSLDANSSSNLSSSAEIDMNSNSSLKNSSPQKFAKRGNSVGNYKILLYTVNGIFVNSLSLSDELVAWETWVDPKGFDFLAIALRSGKVCVFELYYMKLEMPFLRMDMEIISMKYDKRSNTLIMVGSAGEINIKPISFQA